MISTHVLDTSLGRPAQGVHATLEKKNGENWAPVDKGQTNADGRLLFNAPKEAGTFRLSFELEAYFQASRQEFFFPCAQLVFVVQDTNRKYHVPLLLNPYGYSTYRGS